MLQLRWLILTFSVAGCTALPSHAQDTDIKAFLRKAIDAHGGEKLLLKYQVATSKYKGTLDRNGKAIEIIGESSFQAPDKMRNVIKTTIDGKPVQTTYVFDGKTFWVHDSTMAKTIEIQDPKMLKELRESFQAEGGATFVAMLDKPYELASLGDVKVNDRDAFGIRVTKKGQRDFSLYFDKTTYLLLKSSRVAFDPSTGQDVTQDKYFSMYKDLDGLKTPQRIAVHKSGKQFMALEFTSMQHLEKLDDKNFVMP